MRLSVLFLATLLIFVVLAPSTVVRRASADDLDAAAEGVPGKTTIADLDQEHTFLSTEQEEAVRANADHREFEAEVGRLMDIIINSVYSNRDVFLRELVSNASDALDKIRILALGNDEALGTGDERELEIYVRADEDANVIHIRDRGVGMTKADMVNNLGTIAKSGTREFLTSMESGGGDASNLIGQFGVGFYSAFLVADRVDVVSKHNDDEQYIWSSDSAGTYEVSKDPRGNTLGRGSLITLHLKDDAKPYLRPSKLTTLLKDYSEYIDYPIYLYEENEVEENVEYTEEEREELLASMIEEADAAKAAAEADDETVELEADAEDIEEEEADEITIDEVPTHHMVTKTVGEYKRVNSQKPIWTRASEDVTEDEYNAFFKKLAGGSANPRDYTHFKAEGDVNFRALIYIPDKIPSGTFSRGQTPKNVRLYVRRVFITNELTDDIIPAYLSWAYGIIDSDDLPLNVSREILQKDRTLRVIRRKVVRNIIRMMTKMAEDEDEEVQKKYESFYTNFQRSIKAGIIDDSNNRSRLLKLLRFYSTKSEDELVSLEDYVARMAEDQEEIYYVSSDDIEKARHNPVLESLKEKDIEVLYAVDSIDEYMFAHASTFESKKFTNVNKESNAGMSDEEKEDIDTLNEEFEDLQKYFKDRFSSTIDKVTLTPRLATSAAVLKAHSWGYSPHMEKIMRLQALSEERTFTPQKKLLEVNPYHAVIKALNIRLADLAAGADEDGHFDVPEDVNNAADALFASAELASGYDPEDPYALAKHVTEYAATILDTNTVVSGRREPTPKNDDVFEEDE